MRAAATNAGGSLHRSAWTVAAAALALRAAMFALFQGSLLAGVYRADMLYYRTWALGLLDGSWQGAGAYEQGPLYAYLLAAFYRLFGVREALAVGLQLGAGVVTALLAHAVALRLFGRRAAFCAGLLAAGYAPFLLHESLLTKDFLEPLLVLAALWAGLRFGGRRRLGWAAFAGALVALAALVREVHALLLVPLAIGVWTAGPGPGTPRRSRAAALAALAGAFAAVLLPVTARNLAAGEFAAVTAAGGENFYLAFGPEAAGYYRPPLFVSSLPHLEHEDFRREARLRTGRSFSRVDSSRYWFKEALREIAGRPLRAARLLALKVAILVNDYEMPDNEDFQVARRLLPLLRVLPSFGWLFGLGLLGLGGWRDGRGERWGRGLLLGFLAAQTLGLLLTFMLGRYRLAFAALWIILAGRGAVRAWEIAARRAYPLLAGSALLFAGASALAFAPPPGLDPERLAYKQRVYERELEEAALFRERLPGLRAAAAASPRDPAAEQELGESLARTGRVPEAERAFGRALQADPGFAPAHAGLAWISSVLGRFGPAIGHREAVVRGNPASAAAWRELGGALAQAAATGPPAAAADLERRAEVALGQALRLDAGDVEARLQRARLLMIRGAAGADDELAAVLAREPGNAEAERLGSLLGRAGANRGQVHRQRD